MKYLLISMDKNRSLESDAYILGIEGEHKCDCIQLAVERFWGETDLSDAVVNLHLCVNGEYTQNAVCDLKKSDGDKAYFYFPVTRELVCKSGKAQIEFSLSLPGCEFWLKSRILELMIAEPLTPNEEIESSYPGELVDIQNEMDRLSGEISEIRDEQEGLQGFFGYNDSDILGLQVDFENKVFTRLAGAAGKTAGADFDAFPMYGGRRRCNVADDGTIVAYYGDEGYADDGSNGQVMVYQPKFYYRVVPLKLEKQESGLGYHIRKANYYISATPKTGFKLHPAFYDKNGNEVNYILLSAYEGSMFDVSAGEYVNDGTNTDTAIETGDLLCSVAGVKPISGKYKLASKANLELMAQNRGSGWHLETIKATSANQLMMIIELGTMNVQSRVGFGVAIIPDNSAYNCASITGSTTELGNSTGQATQTVNEKAGTTTQETASGRLSVSYRGMENPWGNIWKHIQGINIWGDGNMAGGQAYIADDFDFSETKRDGNYHPVGFTLANASDYISAMGYGNEKFDWLMMPSEIGGTSALPVGDYIHVNHDLSGYRIVKLGGYWTSGNTSGGFCWTCNYSSGYRERIIGGRLLYVPTAVV